MFNIMYFDFEIEAIIWIIPYFSIPFLEVSHTANVLMTICLSYHRYRVTFYPSKYKSGMGLLKNRYHPLQKYIFCVVTVSMLYNIPKFLLFEVVPSEKNEGGFKISKTRLYENYQFQFYYIGCSWILFMILSFLVLIYLNWRIFRDLNEHTRRATWKGNKLLQGKVTTTSAEVQKQQDEMKKNDSIILRKTEKLSHALLALVAVFLFCTSWKLVEEIMDGFKLKPYWEDNFEVIVRLFLVLNSCANVFIYGMVNNRFKQHVIDFLKGIVKVMACKVICVNGM